MPAHRKNVVYFILYFFGAVAVLVGCAVQPLKIETQPWHQQDSGAHYADDDRVFYGIGEAEGTRNLTLLRATAVNHARKEMARVMDQYVAALFEKSGAMSALPIEEAEQSIGALVRKAVKQSVIADQWRDDGQNHLFVLCRLRLDTFMQLLASQTNIDEKARTAMIAESEKVHTLFSDQQGRP